MSNFGFLLPQELQGYDNLGYAAPHVAPGHAAQIAIPDPWAHHAPPLDQPDGHNLRRLASVFLNHPDSQNILVRMEPGPAGRFRVVISFEMVDFL
jgi:hypothetical protein